MGGFREKQGVLRLGDGGHAMIGLVAKHQVKPTSSSPVLWSRLRRGPASCDPGQAAEPTNKRLRRREYPQLVIRRPGRPSRYRPVQEKPPLTRFASPAFQMHVTCAPQWECRAIPESILRGES